MRFKTPFCMDKVMELNIPVRFMIVCLGPVGRVKYEELGRVISTMMINKVTCTTHSDLYFILISHYQGFSPDDVSGYR